MVRGLLGDIIAMSMIWILPITSIGLSKNRIQRFLNAPANDSAPYVRATYNEAPTEVLCAIH